MIITDKMVDRRREQPPTSPERNPERESALARQEGGSHYKAYPIQPVEFIHANHIPFCEANAIKYLCRHREKNKAADLRKAIHYIELLLELEYGERPCK